MKLFLSVREFFWVDKFIYFFLLLRFIIGLKCTREILYRRFLYIRYEFFLVILNFIIIEFFEN